MNGKVLFLISSLGLVLGACTDQGQPRTEGTIDNVPTDKSPNPQTGTGGESQRTGSQGTANEPAPAAKPQ